MEADGKDLAKNDRKVLLLAVMLVFIFFAYTLYIFYVFFAYKLGLRDRLAGIGNPRFLVDSLIDGAESPLAKNWTQRIILLQLWPCWSLSENVTQGRYRQGCRGHRKMLWLLYHPAYSSRPIVFKRSAALSIRQAADRCGSSGVTKPDRKLQTYPVRLW